MHGLLNYDGPVVQFMNKIADCICLSFLWLVVSVPVVTMGAATSALFYSMNKCVRRGEGGVWKNFWHTFRENFKQSTVLGLLLFGLYALLTVCCYSAYLMCANGYLPAEMFYFSLAVPAVISLWACYVLPYAAKFRNSIPMILKNCVYIALMLYVHIMHFLLRNRATFTQQQHPAFEISASTSVTLHSYCFRLWSN